VQPQDSSLVAESEHIVINWVVPLIIIGGSILLGYIFERIVLGRLRRLADRTSWRGDDILINALHGMTTVVAMLLGAYIASFFANCPSHILALIHKALIVLIIFTGTVILGRIAVGFVNLSTMREDGKLPSASILTYVTRAIVYVIGILIILQSLGISITPLLTALGVGGLAVALALQDTLSNLFAGIHIIASKKFRTGDFVRLEGGQEGYVEDISWRNTTIRALSNFIYIVPNNKIASMILTDFDQPQQEMSLVIDVGVAFESDLVQVEKVTVAVAREALQTVTGAVAEFEPFIRFNKFGESAIVLSVILRIRTYVDQYLLKHEFIKLLHRRYQQEGILIPYPIRTVYMKPEEKR
jgi:small-conductance mechanosensitive channel